MLARTIILGDPTLGGEVSMVSHIYNDRFHFPPSELEQAFTTPEDDEYVHNVVRGVYSSAVLYFCHVCKRFLRPEEVSNAPSQFEPYSPSIWMQPAPRVVLWDEISQGGKWFNAMRHKRKKRKAQSNKNCNITGED